MDNYNALSKSAILTKLALDGYFIDLLTLNSFIKDWQIEAIYENEFGIEFFDNSSYLTILNNLKTKYNKNKTPEIKPQETKPAETKPIKSDEISKGVNIDTLIKEAESSDIEPAKGEIKEEMQGTVEEKPVPEPPKPDPVPKTREAKPPKAEPAPELHQTETETEPKGETQRESYSKSYSLEELANSTALKEEYEERQEDEDTAEGIMPRAMKRLTPGPVAPDSHINVDHGYTPDGDENNIDLNESPEPDTMEPSSKGKSLIEYDDELMQILQGEDFTEEEIEKADKLISEKQKESSETQKEEAKEEAKEAPKEEEKTAKGEDKELDLIQLAQSFAQNLTGGKEEKEVPPADLEKIFEESYTEPFEELQNFVMEDNKEETVVEEYKSLQEDLPSDIEAANGQVVSVMPSNPASVQGISSYSNLTAESVREIIREEISRQTKNSPQIPNNDSIKNLVREIVKQTADVAPQNAFKLDISNRTLDLIAKAIAKKIAVKLNDYYKLNSSKQNAKLQMFRDKTIELKERNQTLAEENKKLRMLLLESNKNLNSYKPTVFGLFKFEGKKR